MTSEDLLTHVAAHAGVAAVEAEAATRVVLGGLGGYLSPPRRAQIADELPAEVRTAFLAGAPAALPLEERLLGPGKTVAQSRELIASVCHVLAEELSAEAVDWLRIALPQDLAAMLAPSAPDAAHDELIPGTRDTLARGRPGSHHPIADVAGDRRQTDSIAADNPHGATKLSSSTGATQERRHETIAEGHGDPKRTMSRNTR